ncbi:MAG: precorrin-6y C5,15-methyltransferase (decarboxylating) subunit CbiE [Rhodospirillaceae bacterium]|nr:precorrin-6y C5,15-methyltransferase (decarboxylating) subunit CbiE [Rhodospirillaceae bacterium]MYH35550.1 precorrin-6y C5,15-methyltransferase (decarboxylating) subunit CbiE [Rhodospirillaceae bacterium]MYK14421.1 precorrin-6y C5,15-methyltransferase (decarboxylating) subunit CbiE [Rhodospirillaceae bacterium]
MPGAGTAAVRRWLSIIGVGEDGVEGLGPAARRAITEAAVVFGGRRHLRLVESLIRGRAAPWPSPIRDAIPEIEALRGSPVVVLASGDPFHYGIGSVLAERIAAEEMAVFPAPSSVALAAGRLGWAAQDAEIVSLCGPPPETLLPHLQPNRRVFVLSADNTTPQAVARLLTGRGFGASRMTVLEALGGPDERIRECRADAFDLTDVARLNLMAIAVEAAPDARIVPAGAGLADSLFETDGMLTKREIRAVTLSSLAPRAGELLWDIGTGSGSIAIEWLLAHPANRAVGIERRADRAALARKNAAALGVPRLEIVAGAAPGALSGLPAPNAIFVGGGISDASVLEAAWRALSRNGRLVANSVTLDSDRVLSAFVKENDATLTRLSVERLDRIGGLQGFRPAMTVTQLLAVKP